MLGAIEMLQRGITCVQDDAFLMPYPDPEIIDAVASAYRDSGIRAFLALDQPELTEAEKLPFVAELDDATRGRVRRARTGRRRRNCSRRTTT